MRLFYGPADLLHAASSVKDGVSGAVTDVGDLFDLVGRGVALMDRAEALVSGAERLLHDAQTQLARSAAALDDAQDLTDGARALTARAETELDAFTPLREVAQDATPMLRTVVDSVSAQEIAAVVRVLDRLPQLVDSLETDVLPLLGTLDRVGPDVHDILASVSELAHALQGLPGVGLLQRRGERKADEEEQRDSD